MWGEMEVWSDVVGYPDYLVSTQGEVKSLLTDVTLKPSDNGNGYKKVCLRKEGSTYSEYVHRLVAAHFVDGDPAHWEVDHINGDKADNRADNLRWVTRSQNAQNYCRKSRLDLKTPSRPEEEVTEILMLSVYGLSTVEIGRVLGIPRQTVYSIVRRYTK